MQWFYDLLKYILKVTFEKVQMYFNFNQQNISVFEKPFQKRPYESTIPFATVNSILLWLKHTKNIYSYFPTANHIRI